MPADLAKLELMAVAFGGRDEKSPAVIEIRAAIKEIRELRGQPKVATPGQPDDFSCDNLTLFEAIDGLMAWDAGARDSGINDAEMRKAVLGYLRGLSPDNLRRTLALFAWRYIGINAIEKGYGINDIVEFHDWLRENGIT